VFLHLLLLLLRRRPLLLPNFLPALHPILLSFGNHQSLPSSRTVLCPLWPFPRCPRNRSYDECGSMSELAVEQKEFLSSLNIFSVSVRLQRELGDPMFSVISISSIFPFHRSSAPISICRNTFNFVNNRCWRKYAVFIEEECSNLHPVRLA